MEFSFVKTGDLITKDNGTLNQMLLPIENEVPTSLEI